MRFTVETKELKRQLGMVLFISKDAFVLKSRKATTDSTVNAIFTAKKDKLVVESANEGVSYVKVVIPAKVEKAGKCVIDVTVLSSFSFRAKDVTIEEKGDEILLSSGRMKAQMKRRANVSDIEDSLPDEKIKASITLPVKAISEAIGFTIFSSIDSEIETTLPFILSTTKKGKVYASSLDHFCTSLYTVEGFKEKISLDEMKCIPEGILEKVLRSTNDKEAKVGFSEGQFTIQTSDISVMYPQPQYDIADVVEAVEALYGEKLQLEFQFDPEELYGAIEDVGAMGDTSDTKLQFKIVKNKLICNMEGTNGVAKSYATISGVKGDQKDVAVVYNVMYRFAGQMCNVSNGEACVFSLHNNIVLLKTKDGSVVYTMPTM